MHTSYSFLLSETVKKGITLSTPASHSDVGNDGSSTKLVSMFGLERDTLAAAPTASNYSFLSVSLPTSSSFSLLRQCLDLLVKVQKTQMEGVVILTSLRKRLFPESLSGSKDGVTFNSSPVVKFNDMDREVVRLRILEVKHSSLTPKLFDVIKGVMSPFDSFFCSKTARAATSKEFCGDNYGYLSDLCCRVVALRDQLMGFAQLQEEAIQSLGAQLSALFSSPSSADSSFYNQYYNTSYPGLPGAATNRGVGAHALRKQEDSCDAVLRFFGQLDDVMTSKQHTVFCLAMALKELYDSAAGFLFSSSSSTAENRKKNSADLDVSVSPLSASTGLPLCSTQCDDCPHLHHRSDAAGARLLPAGQVRECRSVSGSESRDANFSPSPRLTECEALPATIATLSVSGLSKSQEGNSDLFFYPQQLVKREISLKSETSRSPLPCTSECVETTLTREAFSASPPPPLARCLQQREDQQGVSRCSEFLPQTEGSDFSNRRAEELVSRKPSQSVYSNQKSLSAGMEEADHGLDFSVRQDLKNPAVDHLVVENARLRQLLEVKDGLILNMQERFLGAVPFLIERVGSNSRSSNSSNCSCHSRCFSNHKDFFDDGEAGLRRRNFAASMSAHESAKPLGQGTSDMRSKDDSSELDALKEKLAAYVEDNRRLQAALSGANEKKQYWKRIAEKLKEENKESKEREQTAKMRCEQLEDNLTFLKKKLLTVESNLMNQSLPSASLKSNDTPLLRKLYSRQSNECVNSGSKDSTSHRNGVSPPSTRCRSETLPPSLRDDVKTFHASTSLQEKRNQLLAKLGVCRNEGTESTKEKTFFTPFESDPIIEVSPLTEERGAQKSSAESTIPLPVYPTSFLSSFHSPATTAVRIDRRLSPEYRSAQDGNTHLSPMPNKTSGGLDNDVKLPQVSKTDVNRILLGARSLLASIGSSKENPNDTKSRPASSSFCSLPSSCVDFTMLDNCGFSCSDEENDASNKGDTSRECHAVVMSVEKPALPKQRSISPCCSLSYSSARKREQCQPGRQANGGETAVRKMTSSSSSKSPPCVSFAKSPQPKVKKDSSKLSPQVKRHLDKPQTARESLIRELRDQLHQLQSQHASVLHQREQLRVKRERVVDAIKYLGDGGENEDRHKKLLALLKRFDTTQQKVLKNGAQLCEYIEIIERQLKTLEDDLL